MVTKERKHRTVSVLRTTGLLVIGAALAAHYLWSPWEFYWKVPQEEAELRMQVVKTAESYLGWGEADGSYLEILDTYNAHVPLARGYTVQPTDSWCATFVSAVSIELELTHILPTECSCEQQILLFEALSRWEERDSAIPLPGDIIYYDWDDSGIGDCTGWSDHVGIVVGTKWPFIKVIEGNRDDAVTYRYLPLNSVRIRGYGVPDYGAGASLS